MRRYTSDLHLGGKQVAAWRYGKWEGNVLHHDRAIAGAWDSTVHDEDDVFILGDIIGEYDAHQLADWLDERPGTKHLVLGNNDVGFDFRELPFATVTQRLDMPVGRFIATLSHYPTTPTDADLLLHGHTHSKERGGWLDEGVRGQVRVHVGWDAWRCVVPEDEVLALARHLKDRLREAREQ